MAVLDSKRLNIVVPHLYPNLQGRTTGGTQDYWLQNDLDEKGTYVVWNTDSVAKPTDQELADAKEEAVDAHWFKELRKIRDSLLVESDWSQGADVPSATKNSYITYRQELRDLPTAVSKPSFATLVNQEVDEWNIEDLMPTKP